MNCIFDNDAAFFDFIKVAPDDTILIYVDHTIMTPCEAHDLFNSCRQIFPSNQILVLPDVSRLDSVGTNDLIHIRESIDAMIKEKTTNEQRTA